MRFEDDFLSFSNPFLTLPKPRNTARSDSPVLSFSPRLYLILQPPLGKDESLPVLLKLEKQEKAVLYSPAEGYIPVKQLSIWIPERHRMVIQLVEQELQTIKVTDGKLVPHGLHYNTYKNCTGPLCRRRTRRDASDDRDLKAMRTGTVRPAPIRPWHVKVRASWPQHYAVDPLLEAFQSHHEGKPLPDLKTLYPEIV